MLLSDYNYNMHAWNKYHTQIAIPSDLPHSYDIWIFDASGAQWEKRKISSTLKGHSKRITGIDWCHQTHLIASCSNDNSILIWTHEQNEWTCQSIVVSSVNGSPTCIQWSPNGSKLAVGISNQIVVCYYDKPNEIWVSTRITNANQSYILSIHWSPNNIFLISGGTDSQCTIHSGYIDVIDSECKINDFSDIFIANNASQFGSRLCQFNTANGWVESCHFSPSGARFAFTAHDSTVHFGCLDMQYNRIRTQRIKRKELPLQCIAFLTDTVAVGGGYDAIPILYQFDGNKWIEKGSIDTGATFVQKKKASQSPFASAFSKFSSVATHSAPPPTMGFAVGGAGDVNNFREAIEQRRIPTKSSITYEGIFSDYYFDTTTNTQSHAQSWMDNQDDEGKLLFHPSYCCAKCERPKALQCLDQLSGDDCESVEYYMSIGLNSNMSKEYFKRPKLNLVIVLDVSGSMRSNFSAYGSINKRKIELARDAIMAITEQLTDDDRFGLVTFNTCATTHFELDLIRNIGRDKVEKCARSDIHASGGTNMECGYQSAVRMFDAKTYDHDDEYSNRIIFLTDMKPNCGVTDINCIYHMIELAESKQHIFTTFIGVGIDIQMDTLQYMNNIKGFNYFYIDNSDDFMRKMDDEFEYMVNPMIFDLKIVLKSEGLSCCVDRVFGVPSSDKASHRTMYLGEVMTIASLFPSLTNENNEVKGGIIVLKLKADKSVISNLQLSISYTDKYDRKYENHQNVRFRSGLANDMIENVSHFDNIGIRKAVLLIHYVEFIHKWLEHTSEFNKTKSSFDSFYTHFKKESEIIEDQTLGQELDILDRIILQNKYFVSNIRRSYARAMHSQSKSISNQQHRGLPFRHQNTITDIQVHTDTKFTTSSADGKLLFWDLKQKY
eukprot:393859_1